MLVLLVLISTSIIGLFAILLVLYFKWCFTYWKKRNVPTIAKNIPFGSFPNPFKRTDTQGIKIWKMYNEFKKRGHKHGAIYVYSKPAYIALDAEISKTIMMEEFQHFTDRGLFANEIDQPISNNLFTADSEKWKYLRQKLTPTFTSGKMRFMFDVMFNCTLSMETYVNKLCDDKESLDICEVAAKYSTDVIGSCAFGIECNCFKNPNSEFRNFGKVVNETTFVVTLLELFQVFRKLFQRIRARPFPKKVNAFFTNVIQETVDFRENNHVKRNDFMQLLIDLKNSGDSNNTLTMSELFGQTFIFYIAGFDTSSGAISFCLFELAQNVEIQNRVRREIKTILAKTDGKVTYESLSEMKYLQQCIDETLRKYPSLHVFNRVCTKDYKFDDGVTIEKDTLVYVPVLAMHRDSDYFPDPEKFDPERFSKENENAINPYAYMPFGGGPRLCIGKRFGIMQTKLGLVTLLNNFEYSLDARTKLPFEFGFNFASKSKHQLLLTIKPIK